jgi:hypothetical protein
MVGIRVIASMTIELARFSTGMFEELRFEESRNEGMKRSAPRQKLEKKISSFLSPVSHPLSVIRAISSRSGGQTGN